MKNPNEAIDRVLAGLRDVEAPEGMERRALAAMEERDAARDAAWSGWRMKMGLVVACGVAAVVVAGVLMIRPAQRLQEKVAGVEVKAPVVTVVKVENKQRLDTRVLRLRVLRSAQHDVSLGRVPTVEAAKAEEERGFPAPPMPLTEEEKMLLRVAHRSDAAELTPLNAEARERLGAEFDEEFIEFFRVPEPVPVPEEKQADPTESDKGETR